MKARFLIGSVANKPRPVLDRPTRNGFLRGMSPLNSDSELILIVDLLGRGFKRKVLRGRMGPQRGKRAELGKLPGA
jgi:hypothetical protein